MLMYKAHKSKTALVGVGEGLGSHLFSFPQTQDRNPQDHGTSKRLIALKFNWGSKWVRTGRYKGSAINWKGADN